MGEIPGMFSLRKLRRKMRLVFKCKKEWHKEDGEELFSISSTETKYKLQPLRFHLIIRINFLAETESLPTEIIGFLSLDNQL